MRQRNLKMTRPAEVRGGHVPAKKLIACSSSSRNHDKSPALTGSVASEGSTALLWANPTSRISSKRFRNFPMTDASNMPCASRPGKMGLPESFAPFKSASEKLYMRRVEGISCLPIANWNDPT
jgi:hypothetical protein